MVPIAFFRAYIMNWCVSLLFNTHKYNTQIAQYLKSLHFIEIVDLTLLIVFSNHKGPFFSLKNKTNFKTRWSFN